MKAAAKTQKPKRQEEHANFISWRFALLCGCILLALAFLLGRVAWLQVISPDMLVKEGDMRSLRVQQVSTSRGMITDRSGRPLAVSVPVKAIWADPKEVHDAGGISVGDRWKALANALNIPLDQLRENLSQLDPAKKLYVNCFSGLRSYLACRILSQNGFDCYHLAGGYHFYSYIESDIRFETDPTYPCGIKKGQNA